MPEDTTNDLKSIGEFGSSDEELSNSVEVNKTTVLPVEMETQTTADKSHKKNELFVRKKSIDRKIPEIGDPVVEEKLNRLTELGKSNTRRRLRKPENTSSKRVTIGRSREAIRTGDSPETDDD